MRTQKSRFLIMIASLVLVLSLSACSAVVPQALNLVSGALGQTTRSAEAAPAPARAPLGTAQGIATADLQATLEKIYQEVSPSVVNIQVTKSVSASDMQGMPQFPGLPSFPGFPNLPNGNDNGNTPQMPQFAQALGSGFVWDNQGHIVTNNHVVADTTEIHVTFSDGVTVPATLVGADPDSDLAVIKVDPAKVKLYPVTVADSTQVKPGQFAVAIGNPYGLEGSMTFGIVSALGRSLPATGSGNSTQSGPSYTIPDIIQTDAPVNPGNSGGVLLDLEGHLIGVPTAIESQSGQSSGIGFAVPSEIVQRVAPVLIGKGVVQHPYIGISGTTLTPELATAMGLPETQRGVLVATVADNSPAAKASLVGSEKTVQILGQDVSVGGDVITAIDGQPVKRFDDLVSYLATLEVGQRVELTVLRGGKETNATLTLAARPSSTPATANTQQQGQGQQGQGQQGGGQPNAAAGKAYLGINGATVTPELATAMGLPQDQQGVLVANVASGSPADAAGLRGSSKTATVGGQEVMVGGDVIVKANGSPVTSIEELVKLIQGQNPGDKLDLTVLRDGNQDQLTVTLAARPSASQ